MSHSPRSRRRSEVVSLTVMGVLSTLGVTGCPASRNPVELANETSPADGDEDREGAAPGESGLVARAVDVKGPRGLACPTRGKGVFLGSGAELASGDEIETPAGVQAELALLGRDGAWLRLAERAKLQLAPGAGIAAALGDGEIVVEAKRGGEPVTVQSDKAHVVVRAGEVRIARAGASTTVDVLTGEATVELEGGDRTRLTPGQRFVAGAERGVTAVDGDDDDDDDDGPTKIVVESVGASLLADAAWAASFDRAVQAAERLPRGMGTLVARRPGSSVLTQRLTLVDQRVEVRIDGRMAHTRVRQTFRNDSSETLEGRYRFPLPSDASIAELRLLVGKTWMDGEMLEKERARRIFKQIVEATVPRDPALLEWEKGSEVELRVFPIPGRGERSVEIAYTQVLPRVGDTLRYRFPMGGSGVAEDPIANFAFDVKVRDEGGHIDAKRVRPVMFDGVAATDGDVVSVSAVSEQFMPSWDLGVDIPVAEAAGGRDEGDRAAPIGASTETLLDQDGQAYVLAALRPKLPDAKPLPVEWAIVLDRSHGTTPEGWMVGRGLVLALLASLPEGDRVTVLACDTACDEVEGGTRPVETVSSAEVTAFLDGQTLAGASDLGAMLERGAKALPSSDKSERVVLYVGDGVPTSGAMAMTELRSEVATKLDGARLFAVALGGRADVSTLDALVRATSGDLMRAGIGDAPDALVRELQLRAHVPALRDLVLETPPGLVDVHPKELPAVRPGDELVLLAKMTKPVVGDIVVREGGPMGPAIATLPVDLVAKPADGRNAHLPRTWAKAEIDWRTATLGDAAREGVIALSQRHNVLSRWTAMLVLENDAMYREFGVKRRSQGTTGWQGELAEGTAAAEDAATGGLHGGDAAAAAPVTPPMEEEQAFGVEDPWSRTEPSPDTKSLEKDEARVDESFFDDGEIGGSGDRASSGAGRGAGGSTSPSGKAAPKPSDKSSSANRPGKFDDWSDTTYDGGGGGGESKKKGGKSFDDCLPGDPLCESWNKGSRPPRFVKQLEISNAAARPDADLSSRVAAVKADPRSRAAHRSLVRAALAAGASDVKSYASAWAAADPEHAPALVAQADALSREGDPMALRAYASAADVDPFTKSTHERLAEAFDLAGDVDRACSHLHALFSLEPSSTPRRVAWEGCRNRLTRNPQGGLSSTPRPNEDVVVFAEGDVNDVELALVERSGRRGSTQWPAKVKIGRTSNTVRLAKGTLSSTMYVEVTRHAADRGAGAPRAVRVVVRTPDGSKSYDVELAPGETKRIAKVAWVGRYVK